MKTPMHFCRYETLHGRRPDMQPLQCTQSEYGLAVSGTAIAPRFHLFANLLEAVETKDDSAALYDDDCTSLVPCV